MIDREQVIHVARLARLELDNEEVERFGAQLNAILDAVSKVSQLNLDDTGSSAEPVRLRADATAESLSAEQALANAPASSDGLFEVPGH